MTDATAPPGTLGYLGRVSAAPGESVSLHVSSSADSWRAQLVRLKALEIPSFDVPRRTEPVPGFEEIHRREGCRARRLAHMPSPTECRAPVPAD